MLYKITNLNSLKNIGNCSGITEIHMHSVRNTLTPGAKYAYYLPKQLYKYVSHIDEISVTNDQIYEIIKVTIYPILIDIRSPRWLVCVDTNVNVYVISKDKTTIILHCNLLQFYPKYIIPLETFQSLPNSPKIQSLFPALDNAERYYFDKSKFQTYSIDPDLIFHYDS